MRRRLPMLCSAVAALVASACCGSAEAAFFPGDAVDGPSPDVQRLGDVDLARDGTGALVYVKRVDGVDHVFVARFEGGAFKAPEQVDQGLAGAGSQPVVGAADAGRLVVAFVSGGVVYGVVRPSGQPFAAPVALGAGSDPATDLSINGTAFTTFTSGGDVRIARLDRRTNGWNVLAQPADADPARPAGIGSGRSKVAISADGIGVVTWGEAGHVYARKMFGAGISNAPQDLTSSPDARTPTVSDLPDIDAEDDSSYAWVVFRQFFADGGSRILARRQRGTAFDPPVALDPGDEPVGAARIDLNGRGQGLAATAGAVTQQPIAGGIDKRDQFIPFGRVLLPTVSDPVASPAIAENNRGLIAAVQGVAGAPPYVRARPYDEGAPGAEATISRPELGPVDSTLGFDAASDRAASAVIAWVQGTAADRRIVAGYFDRPPLNFLGFTTQRCCRPAQPTLTWGAAFDLWGPVRYDVLVDGALAAQTGATSIQLPRPLRGALHSWRVAATDIRGQVKRTPMRLLRVDDLRPLQSIRYKRRHRVVVVSVHGRDVARRGHRASGVHSVVVSWGDRSTGARGVSRVRARHRYRHRGTYPLDITTRDNAGNETVRRRIVRIG